MAPLFDGVDAASIVAKAGPDADDLGRKLAGFLGNCTPFSPGHALGFGHDHPRFVLLLSSRRKPSMAVWKPV